MTLIKGLGLGMDQPPLKHQTNTKLNISIGLRTQNHTNQGTGARN